MDFTHLILTREGPVATITLYRPKALNALSIALEAELCAAFRALSVDEDIRAIVLTGAGRAFSVGVDLKELSTDPKGMANRNWHGPDSLASVMRACPHPIISAVNGFAVTGGLELALAADFLIGSDAAQFADTHARVGITPAWGLTQVLPRLIGINRARQMSLTGAYVGAAQALEWGLLNEVTTSEALLPRAQVLAAEIAETDRPTMGKIRELINISAGTTLSDGFERELRVFDSHMLGVTMGGVAKSRAKVQARGRVVTRGRS